MAGHSRDVLDHYGVGAPQVESVRCRGERAVIRCVGISGGCSGSMQ